MGMMARKDVRRCFELLSPSYWAIHPVDNTSSYTSPFHVFQAHCLIQHTALLNTHFFNAEMATSPNVVLESRHCRIMQWDDHQWIRRQR
jgi:hypothetical protein